MKDEKIRKKVSKILKKLFKEGKWNARKGTKHTLESRLKQSKAKGGDGISLIEKTYPREFNKTLKQEIKNRDNFTCQCCGLTEEEHKNRHNQGLHVHHIDYNKYNLDNTNLITTCNICNNKANINRDYWFAYYTYIMENIIYV